MFTYVNVYIVVQCCLVMCVDIRSVECADTCQTCCPSQLRLSMHITKFQTAYRYLYNVPVFVFASAHVVYAVLCYYFWNRRLFLLEMLFCKPWTQVYMFILGVKLVKLVKIMGLPQCFYLNVFLRLQKNRLTWLGSVFPWNVAFV